MGGREHPWLIVKVRTPHAPPHIARLPNLGHGTPRTSESGFYGPSSLLGTKLVRAASQNKAEEVRILEPHLKLSNTRITPKAQNPANDRASHVIPLSREERQ